MTFILAWRDKSNVYISGDSAVTRQNVSDSYINNIKSRGVLSTSFGEILQISNEKVVEESVLKIHNINDKFILGYAGTGDIALDVINDLEEDEELSKDNIVQKIKNATTCFGSDFQMVIGFYDMESSVLLSFNLKEKRKVRTHSPYTPILLGNLRNDNLLNIVSSSIIETLITSTKNNSADKKILMTNAFVQVVILRANLLAQSVGGFFCGAYLNKKGFFWQKDLGIIDIKMKPTATTELRDPTLLFRKPHFIGITIREGITAILSSKLFIKYSTIAIFRQYINSIKLKYSYSEYQQGYIEWRNKYEREITDIFSNFDYEYFVFICTDKDAPNKMTFVSKESLIQNNYFSLKWIGKIPTFNISGYTVTEINPLTAEFLNQFHWLP